MVCTSFTHGVIHAYTRAHTHIHTHTWRCISKGSDGKGMRDLQSANKGAEILKYRTSMDPPPPPRWNFPTGATGAGRAGAGAGVAGAGTGAGGAGAGGQGVLGRLPDHSSLIYIRCVYDIFGREITEYTAIHGAYIRFWLTLHIRVHTIHGLIPLTIILYTYL